MNKNSQLILLKFSKILRQLPPGVKKLSSAVLDEKISKKDVTANESSTKNLEIQKNKASVPIKKLLFKFPEFLPNPEVSLRNPIREKLERRDMLRRRNNINIPEFYVGSVLAVTSSDKHASGKLSRFVGICIHRKNEGLKTEFILRNVIEHQGVEVKYLLYSPLIQQIEVLRLEKRLDEKLFYLRDAPNEYSTFPFDMAKEYITDTKGVPVNTLKVPLNPRPWLERYERMNLKGAILPEISEKLKKLAKLREEPWKNYDLMDEYRQTVPEEEQTDILSEISEELAKLEIKGRFEKKRKTFIKPAKQKVF